jgi:hypothetical protein
MADSKSEPSNHTEDSEPNLIAKPFLEHEKAVLECG